MVRAPKYEAIYNYLKHRYESEIVVSVDELNQILKDQGGLPMVATSPAYRDGFWKNSQNYDRKPRWLDAGYRAEFLFDQTAVRFFRDPFEDSNWSDEELEVCLIDYRILLQAQVTGVYTSKAETILISLAGALQNRSNFAYEFCMQNISAVIAEQGAEWVIGYKPTKNVGRGVKTRIKTLMENLGGFGVGPTFDDVEFKDRSRRIQRAYEASEEKHPPAPRGRPSSREIKITTRARSPEVVAWVKTIAAGRCEICQAAAPFVDIYGDPFLEVHHIITLAEDGTDDVDNAVACCPNCHREMHFGQRRAELKALAFERVRNRETSFDPSLIATA